MKEILEYKNVKIYLTEQYMFECRINNKTYERSQFKSLINIIDNIKAQRTDLHLPFVFIDNFDNVKSGILKEIYSIDEGKYFKAKFSVDDVNYIGNIRHSISNGIEIYCVDYEKRPDNISHEKLEDMVFFTANHIIMGDGVIMLEVFDNRKANRMFEIVKEKANKELLKLIKPYYEEHLI
jgi:hypothetical protein